MSDYEVIVVNDGSYDNTGQVLDELVREYAPHLRVITHEQNLGYGAALRSGFLAATKDYIFYTDGDGQYDPRDLEQLLRAADPETGWSTATKSYATIPGTVLPSGGSTTGLRVGSFASGYVTSTVISV